MVVTSSGCTATQYYKETIESDSIQEFIDNPSETSPPFETGDTISFDTKEPIILHSRKVVWMKMVVIDMNTVRIRGELVAFYEEGGAFKSVDLTEGVEGAITEVKFKDIDVIDLYKSKVQLSETAKDRMSNPDFMFMIALVLVGIAAGRVF